MKNPINILIADNETEISGYFRELIQAEDGMHCVGCAENGKAAVEMALTLHPDIVLMDIQMEEETDGITAIEVLAQEDPNIKCIVITIHRRDDYLFQAYAAGAVDYILKTDPSEKIIQSIREVDSNSFSLRPEVANKLMRECKRIQDRQKSTNELMHNLFRLTNSELIVLRMFYAGASVERIAKERFIDVESVRTIVKRIQKKHGGKNIRKIVASLKEEQVFERFPFLNDI